MSIIHIVCWKYRKDIDDARRRAHLNGLRALPEAIGNMIEFEAGADMMHLERSFDLALFSRFKDHAALETYNVHPEHQKVAAMGREIAEKVVSVDFESEK